MIGKVAQKKIEERLGVTDFEIARMFRSYHKLKKRCLHLLKIVQRFILIAQLEQQRRNADDTQTLLASLVSGVGLSDRPSNSESNEEIKNTTVANTVEPIYGYRSNAFRQ